LIGTVEPWIIDVNIFEEVVGPLIGSHWLQNHRITQPTD